MTNNPVGLLAVFAVLAAALGSVPLAAATFALATRVRPFSRALRYAGLGVGAVVVLAGAGVATVSPDAGVLVAAVAAVTGVVLWVVPLAIARWLLVEAGIDPEAALRYGTLGLPVALLAALPIAFGDFSRYNVTFLTGVEAAVAWTALALVVFLGPSGVALAIARWRDARRPTRPTDFLVLAAVSGRMDLSWDDLPGVALSVLICEVVGAAPALVTATGQGSWYETLARPALAPPNWVFGPVWTALFALLGVAAYLVLRDGRGRERTLAFGLFVAQYALNVSWTLVFFGGEDVAGGLAVITVLWVLIAATLAAFYRVRRAAGWLLVPYLAWVSFAAYLNYAFWTLN